MGRIHRSSASHRMLTWTRLVSLAFAAILAVSGCGESVIAPAESEVRPEFNPRTVQAGLRERARAGGHDRGDGCVAAGAAGAGREEVREEELLIRPVHSRPSHTGPVRAGDSL